MFKNISEAHERVLNAIDDIKACCEVEDDYTEWSDIAASSIQAFIDDLSAEELYDTCGAFREYISDGDTDRNLALGIQDALKNGLREMLDYIGEIPEDTDEDEPYSDYDRETARIAGTLRAELEKVTEMNV